MREIKFRAWSDEREIMYTSEVVNLMIHFNGSLQMSFENGTLAGTFNTPKLEVMQYTGLKDKNGTEIYEGDVVKESSQSVCGIFEVKWRQEGSPSWILNPAYQRGEMWKLHGSKNKDGYYYDNVEVIGNIYENPELLEGQSCT